MRGHGRVVGVWEIDYDTYSFDTNELSGALRGVCLFFIALKGYVIKNNKSKKCLARQHGMNHLC